MPNKSGPHSKSNPKTSKIPANITADMIIGYTAFNPSAQLAQLRCRLPSTLRGVISRKLMDTTGTWDGIATRVGTANSLETSWNRGINRPTSV